MAKRLSDKFQDSFHFFNWLQRFDEATPIWPLVFHAVYFQIIEKQGTQQLLNDKEEAFDCEGEEMTTLCQFGDLMGRVYGEPMVAIMVYEKMGSENLWNLIGTILDTVKDRRTVSMWDCKAPSYNHKYITEVTENPESEPPSKNPEVKFFNSRGDKFTQSVNKIILPNPDKSDTTFILLPLSQFRPETQRKNDGVTITPTR
jgi:hypothetical protein